MRGGEGDGGGGDGDGDARSGDGGRPQGEREDAGRLSTAVILRKYFLKM